MPDLVSLIRLGWTFAELRGRHRRGDTLPTEDDARSQPSDPPPDPPPDPLPLRHERTPGDALGEAAGSLEVAVRRAGLDRDGAFGRELAAALRSSWPQTAGFFARWDARFQDALAATDDDRANAYLLGRGLAECHWGVVPGTSDAAALDPVLGDDRRAELTRMLGRLPAGTVHPVTPAAVAGSLAAWGRVLDDHDWSTHPDLRRRLYEQVRAWYQLVVLRQDPTTLIRPYGKLGGLRGLGRGLRLFWPQVAVAVLAFGLLTGFLTLVGRSGVDSLVTSLLATGGLGAVTVAGLAARGQSAAQKLTLRLRQDAYTDLVAVSLTIVPDPPGGGGRRTLERAVRGRTLTASTPAP